MYTTKTKEKMRGYRTFSHDVSAAIFVFQNNETAAMLLFQTKLEGVGVFFYIKAFFCSSKFA